MSAIGTFYLLQDSGRDGIVRAAEEQSKALKTKRFGLFSPKLSLNPDPLGEFLRSQTRELEEYPYSGFLLLDIELLAPGSISSEDEIGTRLSTITDSSFISFSPADAARAITSLDKADFTENNIKSFLQKEGRTGDYPDLVHPIQDSARRVKQWLGAVPDGYTGILHIG